MIGKVEWFTDAGGYGLIRRSDGPDVFVHRTAIAGERRPTLNEGDVVEFELVQGAHGPQAANVMVRPKNQRGHEQKNMGQLWLQFKLLLILRLHLQVKYVRIS